MSIMFELFQLIIRLVNIINPRSFYLNHNFTNQYLFLIFIELLIFLLLHQQFLISHPRLLQIHKLFFSYLSIQFIFYD